MLTAIVVGAGFSGLAAGIELRKRGITDFVILEKADRVGGTWRENTYPGAACDVPSHLYSYSFEPNPHWSRSFGGQAEILAYLEHCADRYGLRGHLRFGQHVESATFDEETGTWRVVSVADKGSASEVREELVARTLMLGNGALHIPSLPEIPGLESFEGERWHSARWNHDYDLRGKRVAVVGTGASAIQFVPQIAPQVGTLDLYQRTPPWIIPKRDRETSELERWAYAHVPGAHWLRRTGQYWLMESRVLGFAYAPVVNELAERLVRRHIARSVRDPLLRARVTPEYRLGCKRVLLSNDYYPALQRENVNVITDGITAITPRGVRTVDGVEREVDALIFGTGFRVTEYLSSIRIVGRDGAELNEVWRASLRNYLGITVSGFPNMFLLMGPNTGLGHSSMIFMIEAQARYAAQSVCELLDRGWAYMDVRPDVEHAFRTELVARMKNTVWTSGCKSWYQTPDGDVFLWPAATFDYWWRTRRVNVRDYERRELPIAVVARSTRSAA